MRYDEIKQNVLGYHFFVIIDNLIRLKDHFKYGPKGGSMISNAFINVLGFDRLLFYPKLPLELPRFLLPVFR